MRLPRRLNAMRLLSLVWLFVVVVWAVAAPLLAPFQPDRQDLLNTAGAPGVQGHLLGTDDLGRDVASRIMYGARSAIIVGAVTVVIATLFGTAIGLWAGLSSSLVDNTIMLFMDSLLSIPTVLLAIAIVSFLGYGIAQVMIALGVIFIPVFARLARAETIAVKAEYYVEASRALGSRLSKTVRLHILPNILGNIVVQAALTFSIAIVIESSLSYLGLGTQPPDSSWGLMLKDGRNYMVQAPWLSVFPGLAITFTVLSCNIVGDYLADMLNPKNRA